MTALDKSPVIRNPAYIQSTQAGTDQRRKYFKSLFHNSVAVW
jgi:hypothetical protein